MSKTKGRYERCYEELESIGKGNFGSVYKIKEIKTGELWVSKKIPLGGLPSKEQDGSLQEANLLRTMSHPHVVTYRESFIEGDTLFIIMEYCEGKINRRRPEYSHKTV